LVIQSNNDIDFLRYKVTKIGYYISREELVLDAGIIYTIIEFKKGYRFYTKKQLYFGPYLLKENSSLFQKKCGIELKKLEQIYKMIPKSHYHHRILTYWKIRTLRKIRNTSFELGS
jgi:tRNA (adenine22-N1)-methyltransferase